MVRSELIFAEYRMSLLLLAGLLISMVLLLPICSKTRYERICIYAFFSTIVTAIAWLINYFFAAFGATETLLAIEILIVAIALCVYVIRLNVQNKTAFILFLLYLVVVIFVTVAMRIGMYKPWIKVEVNDAMQAILTARPDELEHLLLNILMFTPFGLIPIINEKYRSLRYGFPAIVLSIWIETTQLYFSIGECDLLDIVGNAIGILIGIMVGRLLLKISAKNKSGGNFVAEFCRRKSL